MRTIRVLCVFVGKVFITTIISTDDHNYAREGDELQNSVICKLNSTATSLRGRRIRVIFHARDFTNQGDDEDDDASSPPHGKCGADFRSE